MTPPTSAAQMAAAQFDYTLAQVMGALEGFQPLPWLVALIVMAVGLAWLSRPDENGTPRLPRGPRDCHS